MENHRMCAEISNKPNLMSLHVDRKSNIFKHFDSPVTKQKTVLFQDFFSFFLNLASPVATSARAVSPFQAPVPDPEGSATAAQQSVGLRNHYRRCSYRKNKRRSIRVERPKLLSSTDATDVYRQLIFCAENEEMTSILCEALRCKRS